MRDNLPERGQLCNLLEGKHTLIYCELTCPVDNDIEYIITIHVQVTQYYHSETGCIVGRAVIIMLHAF